MLLVYTIYIYQSGTCLTDRQFDRDCRWPPQRWPVKNLRRRRNVSLSPYNILVYCCRITALTAFLQLTTKPPFFGWPNNVTDTDISIIVYLWAIYCGIFSVCRSRLVRWLRLMAKVFGAVCDIFANLMLRNPITFDAPSLGLH
jgi:hypothetical protein